MHEGFQTQQNMTPQNSAEKNGTPEKMQELISQIMNEAEALEIKPEDRNEKNELLVSPEGAISNLGKQSELWWKIARTESFKKFFGDWQNEAEASSKILDKNGEPLVLFRGIHSHFEMKDFYNKEYYQLAAESNKYADGAGVYFSPRTDFASQYGEITDQQPEGGMFPVFVNARRPLYKESLKEQAGNMIHLIIPKRLMSVISKIPIFNHDSMIGENRGRDVENIEDANEVIIRDPSQVLIIPNNIKNIYKSK